MLRLLQVLVSSASNSLLLTPTTLGFDQPEVLLFFGVFHTVTNSIQCAVARAELKSQAGSWTHHTTRGTIQRRPHTKTAKPGHGVLILIATVISRSSYWWPNSAIARLFRAIEQIVGEVSGPFWGIRGSTGDNG